MLRSLNRLFRLNATRFESVLSASATPVVTAVDSKSSQRLLYSTRPRDVEDCNANVLRSRYSDIETPTLSYSDFIFENFGQFGDLVALECGVTGRNYTYELVQLFARKLGSALVRRGLQKGDVVGLICPNIPEFAVVVLGVSCVGGTVSTANPTYTAEEIARQMQNSNAKFVVTVGPLADKIKEALTLCPLVQEAFVIGDAEGMTPIASFAAETDGAIASCPPIDVAEDLLLLPYSSGTTGLPKGVMLTHQNVTTNIMQCTDPRMVYSYNTRDTVIAILPFFHSYAFTTLMSMSMRYGLKVVTLPYFDTDMFLKAIHQHKPTVLHLVPPLVHFLATHPQVNVEDLVNIRNILCGAAPLSTNMVNTLVKRLHPTKLNFQEGYGMTELSPVSHVTPMDCGKIGTCGLLIPNTEGKVIDIESGEALGPNCEGEVCVRGPQVMKGYLNNPKATQETIDEDGWIHTGDIGNYDEEGYFHVFDRMKELIKVKGLQVAPSELEDLLLSHPGIEDAAVIGIPDDKAGELPKAYVVLRDRNLTKEDIAQFCNPKVAPHKQLKGGVEFISSIPKTQTGKILRRELRAQVKV